MPCDPITPFSSSTKLCFLRQWLTPSKSLPPPTPDVTAFGALKPTPFPMSRKVLCRQKRLRAEKAQAPTRKSAGSVGPAPGPPAGRQVRLPATNARAGLRRPVSRPLHSHVWSVSCGSQPESVPWGGVPPAQPPLGPHTPRLPQPRPGGPAAREHTWSSSLMSMKAGTLMVKARARRPLHSQTTPTGKGGRRAPRRFRPLPGHLAPGSRGGVTGWAGPRRPIPPRWLEAGRACPLGPPP